MWKGKKWEKFNWIKEIIISKIIKVCETREVKPSAQTSQF